MENKTQEEYEIINKIRKDKVIYDLTKNKSHLINEIDKKNAFIEKKSKELIEFISKKSNNYSEYQLEMMSYEELLSVKEKIKENKRTLLMKIADFFY